MKYCEKCLAKNGNFDFFVMALQCLEALFATERERVMLQMSCGAERAKHIKKKKEGKKEKKKKMVLHMHPSSRG